MRPNQKLIFLLIFSIISQVFSLQCGDENIEHCLECGTGEEEGTCTKCEDNYFQFLFNYLCLPCDHKIYGDTGCQGNCKIDDSLNRFVCDEFGCKEGFYSLDKISCMNCNALGHEFCAKCSYLPPLGKSPSETDERKFNCSECINDDYKIFPDGRCRHCYKHHCSDCHFEENSFKSICDKCNYDYYLSGGDCVRCLHYGIYGGYCRKCTDDSRDSDHIYCHCNLTYYQNTPYTCVDCPRGCWSCKYDEQLSGPRCDYCKSGYALNKRGTCTYCGRGCSYCSLDQNENPLCEYCYSGYKLIDKKCYDCPTNCETCHLNEENDQFICDHCFYGYAMNSQKECIKCPSYCDTCEYDSNSNLKCTSCYGWYWERIYYGLNANSLCDRCPSLCQGCFWKESISDFGCSNCFFGYALKDDECLSCPNIPELGSGCEHCSYNTTTSKYQCYRCINRDYCNVTNSYECISNTDPTNTQLYGCLLGKKNYATGKYECNICKPEFIPILNDKNCRRPTEANLHSDCREAINIGTESAPIYSCTSCKSWFNHFNTNVTDHRGAHDCYSSTGELILCEKATKNEAGYLNCTKCMGNFKYIFSETYNKMICNENCEPDGFKKNFWCYKCEDKYFGNPGCVGEKGCTYISDNDQLNCNECKVGYFKYTHGQCYQCKEGDKYCTECHMNETENRFECEKCMENYFVNKNKKCELITCDEHPEVSPGCIICKDKLTQYKSEGKCQACKDGYFKTKEGKCVHCKAKKNGGPGCELCEYAKDEEGNDSDEIICKHCPGGFLTTDGKCYNCKDELENGCRNCTLKVNEVDQTEKLICTNCINNNYILTNNSHCIHINSFVQRIPFCLRQYNYLDYSTDDNQTIDNTDPFEPPFNFNNTPFDEYNNTPFESYNNTPFDEYNNTTTDFNTELPYEDEFYYNDDNNNTNRTYKIKSVCQSCKDGYILQKDNTCAPVDISNCSFSSILLLENFDEEGIVEGNSSNNFILNNDITNNYLRCNNKCQGSKFVAINYYYETTEQVKVYYKTNNSDYDDYNFNDDEIINASEIFKNSDILESDTFNDYNISYGNYTYDNYTYNNYTYDNYTYNNYTYNNYTYNNYTYNNYTYNNYTHNNYTYNNYTHGNYKDDNYTYNNNSMNNDSNIPGQAEMIEMIETRIVSRKVDIKNIIVTVEEIESLKRNNKIMSIISKGYLCLDNLGTGQIYSPENLRKCKSANYYENNDTYECTECIKDYSLDEETKTCKQSIKVKMNLRPGFSNCYARNIRNYSNPLYSCEWCYNYGDIKVTSDTGAKFCVAKKGELEGCSEVYADTTYLNNVYNCTFCDNGFISYYNIFFEKITCQDIHFPPKKIREIDITIFDPEEVEHVSANESGLCENGKLFTPDGINCYACNNRTVGMVGCKGTCEFNLKKNISLKCEEGMCKTGFIEKTKGVCEPCETINLGCIECHYEDNYLEGYYGFKRKRRFACDQCDNGYLISEDGTCHHCSTLGFTNCKNCGIDPNHDNEIVCLECQPGYFVNDEGKCAFCYENRIRGKNNICISCDDIENGGIEGCEQCQNVDNEPQCTQCKQGFILLENNYTCLRISSNVELEESPHCNLAFLNDNGHFECKKCENNFVLLEENNNIKCFSENYIPSINPNICEIFENLGNEDKPIYSCVSCRNNEFVDIYPKKGKARITYQINNTAICEYRHRYSSLENCTEAVMIPDNLNVTNFKLNCTECIKDNILYYHKNTDMNICKYKYFEKQCVVKYCKTCVPGNNYYCQECLPANYEVSSLTGGCVRKVDKSPAVYFKDIFRLKLNQYKQIGAKRYYGPFFSLRGLTNSQVNTGHAFLVLLSFKLHYTRNNRMLEEEKSVKTYCQIVESMDETSGEPNLVDFDCIGDTNEEEDLSEYDLNAIEESPDDNIFEGSNLNELAQSTDLKNLGNKNKTSFELKNYIDLVVFNPNEVNNITSKDYHFDLTLSGKLNKDLQEQSLNVQIPLNQIQDKKVGCTFNIKTKRNAELKCDLDFKEYEDNFNMFSLKVTEITDSSDTTIYLSRINEIKLIPEGKDKDNTVLIVVIVVVCVFVIAGGIVGGIFLYKRYKKKKSENNILDNNNKGNENAQNHSDIHKLRNVVPESKEQVINFQN